METKEQLITSIKEWVKIDNEIRALQKEQNQRKNEKKRISKTLIEVMKNNEIDCFDIKDGQITYSKKTIQKPINKKILLTILSKFYDGDTLKAGETNDYIMNNREHTVKETICRKINKTNLINEVV
jgi:hypothetical protein